MQKFYPISPCPAPRMTQRDKWKKRPIVQKYFAFRDEVKLAGVSFPDGGSRITFYIEMPASWSAKKRAEMDQQPHQQRPDVTNLMKALEDAVYRNKDDCVIWDVRIMKRWADVGGIHIETGGE